MRRDTISIHIKRHQAKVIELMQYRWRVNPAVRHIGFVCIAIFCCAASGQSTMQNVITLEDGNALLAVCSDFVSSVDRGGKTTDRDIISAAACTSYLRGFNHGVAILSNEPEGGSRYCIQESVPSIQVARVLIKYLRETPSTLHLHPALLTVRAMRQGFPCSSK